MKNYTINLYGKEIIITQNDDGTFNKPQEILDYVGIGTATKPAHEPICMARKPLTEKTVAENCLKWGTGGINIDESRVEVTAEDIKKTNRPNHIGNFDWKHEENTAFKLGQGADISQGRFPANLIHDNSEEVRECFPESKGFSGGGGGSTGTFKTGKVLDNYQYFNDSGNASRFFKSILYYPKASKSERNMGCEGLEEKPKVFNGQSDKPSTDMKDVEKRFTTLPKANNHPTVKPIALMEYIIKMVTPKGGIVLDPFAGSGTTLVAAKQNGFQYVGFELTDEYIPIIEARINAVNNS